jgi:hypothetical protein
MTIKPKRTAEQQIADEASRLALHPLTSRQTIVDQQANPDFQTNHNRLRAERLAREAAFKPKS